LAPDVRPMVPRDRSSVMAMLRDTSEFKDFEVDIAAELIDAYLDQGLSSGYFVLVAEVEGRVAGYVCYGPTPLTTGTWDVYWMAVSKGAQRHGLGKALLAAAETEMKSRRGRLILIETSSKPNYVKAQSFYAREGYEMISRIYDFYEPGDDKLTYLKRLD
jgi:ribosomal protein S18 acetylase RimI-like enzyme